MGHSDLQVRAWDIEGFTSWDSYPEALRVLVVDEEELPQPAHRRRKTPFPGRPPRAFYATDLSCQQLPTRTMWELAHRRWTLENTGFHQFKPVFRQSADPNIWIQDRAEKFFSCMGDW